MTRTRQVPVVLTVANQQDIDNNPGKINQTYSRLDLGLEWGSWGVAVGREVLGGSLADGQFFTPLATLHKFNGWADLFVFGTPANGLVDSYVSARYTDSRFAAILIYHDFDSEATSQSWGSEYGRLEYTAPWKQVFAVKFADYDAASFASSRRKLWLYTSYRFGSS